MTENTCEYAATVQIFDLPDDCLLFIFEHLTLTEKFAIVRVSKSFKRVINELLKYSETEIKVDPWTPMPLKVSSIQKSDFSFLQNFRFESVEKLSLQDHPETKTFLTAQNLEVLLDYFPCLNSLSLISIRLEGKSVNKWDGLAAKLKNLESLNLAKMNGDWKKFFYAFSNVVSNSQSSLTSLQLSQKDHWTENVQKVLESTVCFCAVQKLVFCKITLSKLLKILATKPQLKQVTVSELVVLGQDDHWIALFEIIEKLEFLENLSLDFFTQKRIWQGFYKIMSVNAVSKMPFFSMKRLDLCNLEMTVQSYNNLFRSLPCLESLRFRQFGVTCDQPSHQPLFSDEDCQQCANRYITLIN